jgi:two-component system OmpR family response regulator
VARPRDADAEKTFFELLQTSHPDVIVLDCRGDASNGVAAVQKIRRRVETPILIICAPGDRLQRDYRVAGAADCLEGPFDILQFNQAIQHIIRLNRPAAARAKHSTETFEVAGLLFQPAQNEISRDGVCLKLTTAENRLLLHFLSRPFTICSRSEIADILYGAHRPSSDRAIDIVVTRLRKKLMQLRGEAAGNVIRTEFRQGYMFVGKVNAEAAPTLQPAHAWEGSGREPGLCGALTTA